MPASRHFEIIYMLLNKRRTTARELAAHFEVSTRTIYRDIDVLSAAGIPVYSTQGKGGGIFLLDDYVFNTSLLSEHEQNDILIALQSLNAAAYPDIDGVLSKLSHLFKKGTFNWLEVDFSPWGSSDSKKELFHLLQKAILNHRVIRFRYYNNSGRQSERRVEPMKLSFKDKAWYLYGYCLDQANYRTFKINRMKEVQQSDTSFEPREVEEASDGVSETSISEELEVELHISSKGAFRVYDEFEEEQIKQQEDGSFIVRMEMPQGSWLFSYILSFGTLIQDIQPEQLRLQIRDELKTMSSNLIK